MWWLFWLNDPIWHRHVTFKEPFKEHFKVPLTIAQIFDAVLCPKSILPYEDVDASVSDNISHWHLPDINEDINI